MEMYTGVIVKTIIFYFFIMFVYRVLGKKEVGHLSMIDFIVSILIVELIAISIADHEEGILISIIPVLIVVGIQLLLSYISMKNSKIRDLIEGKPTVIIKDGKINFKEMASMRYNLDDLIAQLREKGVESIEHVGYAVLENTGKLSVFETSSHYPFPLIMDGQVDSVVLHDLNKNMNWLMTMLEKKNVKLEDVFYAFYTPNKIFIITHEDLLR